MVEEMILAARVPRAFLTLWLVTFLGYFSFQLLTASLPLYAVTLGADNAALGLLSGVIALISLLSRPWVGWWLDRGDARWGMAVAGGIYALSALGFLSSRSVVALVGFRAFTGLGIALSATTSLVLTIALAPEHRRGEALSLLSLANSIGQGVGPATGIAIPERAGYPGLFATCAVLGAVAGGLALNLRSGSSVQASRPRDRRVIHSGVLAPGLILAPLSLCFGVAFGLQSRGTEGRGSVPVLTPRNGSRGGHGDGWPGPSSHFADSTRGRRQRRPAPHTWQRVPGIPRARRWQFQSRGLPLARYCWTSSGG